MDPFSYYSFGLANGKIITFTFDYYDVSYQKYFQSEGRNVSNIIGRFYCDIVKSIFSFDGKNWTSNIVETSDDDEKFMCNEFYPDGKYSLWFQLTVIKNLRNERLESHYRWKKSECPNLKISTFDSKTL